MPDDSVRTAQTVVLGIALAGELGLVALAWVHLRTGRFERVTWWVTRLILVGAMFTSVAGIWSAIWEITTFDYPWTLPGRPMGTFAEPTAVGVGMVAVDGGGFLIAAVLAWVRPRAAAALLIAGATAELLVGLPGMVGDATAPPWNWAFGLVVGPTLPALTLAALLLSLSRRTATR